MPNTAAALAPELMPMMSGDASGLRSIVWKVTPAMPNAKPASSPSAARGSRSSPTVKDAPGHGLAEDHADDVDGPVERVADHERDHERRRRPRRRGGRRRCDALRRARVRRPAIDGLRRS